MQRNLAFILCRGLGERGCCGQTCPDVMDLIKRLLVHPVTWETMRFGVLFTSAEVTQQILVKRVFNKDDRFQHTEFACKSVCSLALFLLSSFVRFACECKICKICTRSIKSHQRFVCSKL